MASHQYGKPWSRIIDSAVVPRSVLRFVRMMHAWLLLVSVAALHVGAASAQYPTKPIRLEGNRGRSENAAMVRCMLGSDSI